MNQKEHWENIYETKSVDGVSWYAPHLQRSLELIDSLKLDLGAPIIDIGAGASSLAADLITRGYRNLTVLDISQSALDQACTGLAYKYATVN